MKEDKAIEAEELQALNEILKNSPYKPVSKISYGSFGQIFKIQDDKREYALKVIGKQRMARQQKIHEAVIEGFVLSRMNHPGIIKYYQTIETKEYICQVIQYCPFGDLFGVFKKVNKNMELVLKKKEISLFYLAQILDSLCFIHSKGIIHRDLKLENVVVASDLSCRIIDFGTAKPIKMEDFYTTQQIQFITKLRKKPSDIQEEVTRSKSFVGSANYLSPESISLEYSLASDIWSFGILAYKIFHGKLPFEGENNYEIFKKIKQNQFTINQKADPEIHDLIRQCLKVNPEERPTALELKKHPYFKNANFTEIFKQSSPINKQILVKTYNTASKFDQSPQKSIRFEVPIQKKMFFGNYKPRILKVYKRGDSLYMSYWYIDAKAPKNEFQLNINDYAQSISKTEFDVLNRDVRYTFKVGKALHVEEVVNSINALIRKHFQLQ